MIESSAKALKNMEDDNEKKAACLDAVLDALDDKMLDLAKQIDEVQEYAKSREYDFTKEVNDALHDLIGS